MQGARAQTGARRIRETGMAKAPAKPEVAPAPTPAPKKSKLLIIIGVILVLLLIIVAALVGVLVLVKGKGSGDAATPTAAAPAVPAMAQIDLSKPPVFVQLDTFTVNLAREETDHYLQAVIVLRVADSKVGGQLSGFMPAIRHAINLLLSSKTPSQINTIEGREQLAFEALEKINEVLGFPPPRDNRPGGAPWGPVQAVLFNSFIIQ
jgi:flagellar protein FliL